MHKREEQIDESDVSVAVQKALIALTTAGTIRWKQYDNVPRDDLDGECPDVANRKPLPCYGVDLRFTLRITEVLLLHVESEERALNQPASRIPIFGLYVDLLDERSEVNEPGVMLQITDPRLLAEAAKSNREDDDFFGELQRIIRKK